MEERTHKNFCFISYDRKSYKFKAGFSCERNRVNIFTKIAVQYRLLLVISVHKVCKVFAGFSSWYSLFCFWNIFLYDSIVGYDEEKMEAVTRSVANRELRGVTLWGGLIGFGVGFVGSLLVHALHL